MKQPSPLCSFSFLESDGTQWKMRSAQGEVYSFLLNNQQQEEWKDLILSIEPDNKFHLLNIEELGDRQLTAELIIFEPDYLIDISSLAECFRPYGNHPLNYLLSRLQQRENTAPVLLGNTANYFIDQLVNEADESPVEYLSVLKEMFKTSAFEFSTCSDLKDSRKEKEFFSNTATQFKNIRNIVYQMFPRAGMDRDKLILEPSFICNALGLQGRLDLMQTDYSAFIELKSGKAIEDFRTHQYIRSGGNHYMQMILYLAVLEFNLRIDPNTINSYLLYSRYPLLSKEAHSRKHLKQVLHLRNKIVLIEYLIQKNNDAEYTRGLLEQINSKTLNLTGMTGKLFDQYLAPAIDHFGRSFAELDKTEQDYVLRLYSFISKELWYSKAGERDYEGTQRAANLWNAPFGEKLAAGEILYHLSIAENRADSEEHTITLGIPLYEDLYLPNFRQGDMIILYERNQESDTINNRRVFKGNIESLNNESITIRLRYRQKNPQVWNPESTYAIEHDYVDTNYTAMFRALDGFVHANKERRDLLLCRRMPESNYVEDSSNDQLEQIVQKSLATKDCFLLIGPPGTGKTSLALRQMTERAIEEADKNILLLAYTNRAVDEICKALLDIEGHPPFIRIGSELNCDPNFRSSLLENKLDACNSRKEVTGVIEQHRIFVGTVASVWSKSELFILKTFDLAIIDEATQLLEPHLLGILSMKTTEGNNAVRRFILIGDHKQLPAIVLQSREESAVDETHLQEIGLTNLSDSLFERLYRTYYKNKQTQAYDRLTRQGRMHPAIAVFPSLHFYNGDLHPVGLPHQLEDNAGTIRLSFHDIKPIKEDRADKSNLAEAQSVIEICKEQYKKCSNIGIITPFRNQIALIRKLLNETNIPELQELTVDTVERFQGSQRDIIIYSFCIKTPTQLSALPNNMEEDGKLIDRKLNVALTRARKSLYIVGNKDLLCGNPTYRNLIEHIGSMDS